MLQIFGRPSAVPQGTVSLLRGFSSTSYLEKFSMERLKRKRAKYKTFKLKQQDVMKPLAERQKLAQKFLDRKPPARVPENEEYIKLAQSKVFGSSAFEDRSNKPHGKWGPVSNYDLATQRPKTRDEYLAKLFPRLEEVNTEVLQTRWNNEEHTKEWYALTRNSNNRLPVYTDIRRGYVYTTITNIQGNISQLKEDLRHAFDIPKRAIGIRNTSKTIYIKGNITQPVRRFLEAAI